MIKIIIDADPGLDDTFAILLAAKSKELDIKAITTVAGNCSLENATNNTFKALDLANRNDVPVYKGMDKALKVKNIDATYVHGNNGMGGISYEPINRNVEDIHAVDYLLNAVRENPNEITVVAVGPLTNIACAIQKDHEFAKNVKSLIIMGGSTDEGNVTPHAEFNFYKDPHAAKIVFESDFNEIIMMGLNVTSNLPLNEKLENILQNTDNELAKFLYDITRTGAKFDRSEGFDGAIINDPITIAYLIDPSLVELKNAEINIETEGEKAGKSNVTFVENSNYKVGYKVDPEKFYKLLFKRILDIEI